VTTFSGFLVATIVSTRVVIIAVTLFAMMTCSIAANIVFGTVVSIVTRKNIVFIFAASIVRITAIGGANVVIVAILLMA